MTASIRYVPNRGFKAWLLNAPGTMSEVGRAASAIHSRAVGMFGAANYVLKPPRAGKVRCHAIVATGDRHAVNSNALHMTLQKSLKG